MKQVFYGIILGAFFILPTRIIAQAFDLQILDSLTNKPIENVYIYDNNQDFTSVSDKNGKCHIVVKDRVSTTYEKIVNISHIGYVKKLININYSKNNSIKILLSPNLYELKEVIISPPNAGNIIKKAIENIPNNYSSLIGDTIVLNVSFIFFDNPESKVADFKGNIAVTSDGESLLAAKYKIKNNVINESFYDYRPEISPGAFYSIIFIKNHVTIRSSKKVKFLYDGIIQYQGVDTYKISFTRKSKYTNFTGYMLINIDDYAITYITYELGEIKKWIATTQKSKGLFYTNLEHYKVSSSYIKDIKGYKFSEGTINMLFNRTRKKKILSNNTYDVSVKAKDKAPVKDSLIYLKANELFKKE